MKFKIGDYVKIKEELSEESTENFISDMEKYRGKVAKIIDVKSDSYSLDIDDGKWHWNEYMVDSVKNKTYNITVAGNMVTVTDDKGNTGIAICSPEDEFNLSTGISLALDRLRWKPTYDESYWTIDFSHPSLTMEYRWDNDSTDKEFFKNGLVFKTQEEAKNIAKKMLEAI